MSDHDQPVGVFDSGVGGLTVAARIMQRLPWESIIYLGDTARVPYGTKSPETVSRYARGCARILMNRGIKLLVVACNTASAYALGALRAELPVPVLGVIEPGIRRAVAETRNGRIGVIGTRGTIDSGKYQAGIMALSPTAQVLCAPCPLFVPLAEEGWADTAVAKEIAGAYLAGLAAGGIDTLVLGCTHYPLLRGVIASVVGPQVVLIDSAETTADVVADTLQEMGLERSAGAPPIREFLVTDDPDNFARIGGRFLGRHIERVEWVDL